VYCITRSGNRQQIAELGVENSAKFAQKGDIMNMSCKIWSCEIQSGSENKAILLVFQQSRNNVSFCFIWMSMARRSEQRILYLKFIWF